MACLVVATQPALAQAPAPRAEATQAASVVRDYALPAGPLAATLNRIAREAGLALSIDAGSIGAAGAAPVHGRLSARQALVQALIGSGFELVETDVGSFTLRRLPPVAPAAPAASVGSNPAPAARPVLPAVAVTAPPEVPQEPGRFARRGVPSPVEPGIVTAAALERYAADDLEDTLASQPEVVVGGGHAIAQRIYLRGIEDQLLAVSVDGAAIGGRVYHHAGNVQIEPDLIKRVEVLAGTGDATAGPGALGGALRLVTKDPQDLLRPGERAGALLKGGYASNAEGGKGHATVFTRLGAHWAALLSYTYQDQKDYEDGAGRNVAATAARQQLALAKLAGYFEGGHALRLGVDATRDEGMRTQRPQWVPSSFNRAYPLEAERRTVTLGWDWQPGGNAVDLQVTAFDTRQDLAQDVVGRWGLFTGRVESRGAEVRNASRVGAHRLTYGLDHRRDDIRSGYGSTPGEFKENGTISGLYLQDRIKVTPALQIDAGLRHDRYRLTDVNGLAQRADGTSPNASLRWTVLPDFTLLAGHARALRGPKVREAFKQEGLASVPGIKPERARTSEAGFEYAPGAWRLNAKAYATEVRDAIADPIGRPTRFENVGTVRSRGVLLHAAWEGRALRIGTGLHHNKATLNGRRLNGYDHNGLGISQGDTLTTSLDWRATDAVAVGWTSRLVKGIDALETSAGTVRKPGYGVHDVYATWHPAGMPGLTLSLTVKNLFDKDYLDHGSNEDFQHIPDYQGVVGSREPGRELRLGVALRF
ncbi:MAG: TonB-dependent receptor domain-containing protein [Pseudomonadota bacterium]